MYFQKLCLRGRLRHNNSYVYTKLQPDLLIGLCCVLIDHLILLYIDIDLAIYFTPSLDFNHHINITVCQELKILVFIKRNTKMFCSVHCLRTLNLSLVRPILEYGTIVWHQYLAKDQLRLQRAQNRFLSYIYFLL